MADAQVGNLLWQVQQWAPRGLHVQTALSPSGEAVRGLRQEPWLKPSRSGLQSRFKTFVPFMDICKIIKKPTFKSYNL